MKVHMYEETMSLIDKQTYVHVTPYCKSLPAEDK